MVRNWSASAAPPQHYYQTNHCCQGHESWPCHDPSCCSAIESLTTCFIRSSKKSRFLPHQFLNLCQIAAWLAKKTETFRRDPPLCGQPSEKAGRDGGRTVSCNSSEGNKDTGNKSGKTEWKYSCTAQIAPFCNFYFLCLWALVVRRRRAARDFQPITVPSQPVGSVRENECVIFKQLLGILCTDKPSQQHFFLRGYIWLKRNMGDTSVGDCF